MVPDEEEVDLIDEPVNEADLFGNDVETDQLISPAPANDVGDVAANAEKETGKATVRKKTDRAPILNALWICKPQGAPAVNDYFKGVKFRGKGHEATDLKMLLQKYEYWAQLCYPKFCFKDFVEKVESLSSKRPVKSMIFGIRNQYTDALAAAQSKDQSLDAISQEDNLPGSEDEASSPTRLTAMSAAHTSPPSSQSNGNLQSESGYMTENMREFIRRKREEALAKRKRKLDDSFDMTVTGDVANAESQKRYCLDDGASNHDLSEAIESNHDVSKAVASSPDTNPVELTDR